MEVKIKQGNGMLDATIKMVDGVMVVSPKEVKNKPKDGDVVFQYGKCKWIFIYKDCSTVEAYEYVSLELDSNEICFPNGGHIGYVDTLRPATEEEKKKLFDKLAEKGYEFDFEKKELVKLKWKPKEGEEFWFPLYYASPFEFEPITSLLNKGRDKAILDKGWCFKTKEECQEFCNRLNDAINSVKP